MIPWEIVNANPQFPWDYSSISENPSITWDIIQQHPEKPWDYSCVSENPSITWDIVQQNPQIDWKYDCLSKNNMKHAKNIFVQTRLAHINTTHLHFKENITFDLIKQILHPNHFAKFADWGYN